MWTPGSMAMTSGSASTPCMGRFGRGCCRTTCSGTRRGNATDGTCGWCLSSILRQSGGSCRYSTETGRRHPCHGAVADSLGPIAIVIPQLQYIDQVFDVLVAQVQQIRAKTWETVEIPQLQLEFSWTSCCSPVACNNSALGR